MKLPEIELKPGRKLSIEVELTVEGEIEEKRYEERYVLPAKIEVAECEECSKKDSDYYEAVIQTKNFYKDAENYLKKELSKQRVGINEEVEVERGKDYYLTKKQNVEKVIYSMKKKFGARIKRNRTYYGEDRQTSKKIYRDIYFVELPGFREGEVILKEERPVKILEVKKKIKGVDLEKQKVIIFQYRGEEYKKLSIEKAQVIQKEPEVQVLNPETYQEEKLNSPPKDVKKGEEVEVVQNKKIWAVNP